MLRNLIYYWLPKSIRKSQDKDWHINIPSHAVLGKLYELIIILSHSHIPIVKSLKLICNSSSVLAVEVCLSKQVLKNTPAYLLCTISITQSLYPYDGSPSKLVRSKSNMIFYRCRKVAEEPLDDSKPSIRC